MVLEIPTIPDLPQEHRRPIVIVGAGGIVLDAHLPAYIGADLPIAGVFDVDVSRAQAVASRFGIHAFPSLDDALAVPNAVFDLATPPHAHAQVVAALPSGAGVLIQKPFGRTLSEATQLRELVRTRSLTAAVNFQLKSSQMVRGIFSAIGSGQIGQITDVEISVNIYTPWEMFPFVRGLPRMEICNHSIHYLDLVREILGQPSGVFARSLRFPGSELTQTRTSVILDYGQNTRCTLSVNHEHDFGRRFQNAIVRVEGTKGAVLASLGVLLDYPKGEPDGLWFAERGQEWQQLPLREQWFPHAFAGSMINLQRVLAGLETSLLTPVDDAWRTMALVEACYEANGLPGTPVPHLPY